MDGEVRPTVVIGHRYDFTWSSRNPFVVPVENVDLARIADPPLFQRGMQKARSSNKKNEFVIESRFCALLARVDRIGRAENRSVRS